jgi:hypothetical protein
VIETLTGEDVVVVEAELVVVVVVWVVTLEVEMLVVVVVCVVSTVVEFEVLVVVVVELVSGPIVNV